MAKTGETLKGSVLFLASKGGILSVLDFIVCVVPLSCYFVLGVLLLYSTWFYSQSISDRFSAHVRPVLHFYLFQPKYNYNIILLK